jgi:hypothetical protein
MQACQHWLRKSGLHTKYYSMSDMFGSMTELFPAVIWSPAEEDIGWRGAAGPHGGTPQHRALHASAGDEAAAGGRAAPRPKQLQHFSAAE